MRNLIYKPTSNSDSRPMREDDVAEMRAYYFKNESSNLKFLLEKRFGWMNNFIKNEDNGIELGSGTGLSKLFIKCRHFRITDLNNNEWLDDKNIDALGTPYENDSLDFVIVSNLIYTISEPMKFFKEMNRILKPGGVVIIHEINASWSMRKLIQVMNKAGYDFTTKVFEEHLLSNDFENIAVPRLLFDSKKLFEQNVSEFKIVYSGFSEFLLLINSGGLATKKKHVRMPKFLLRLVNLVDKILIGIAPQTFALQRQIVIQKQL